MISLLSNKLSYAKNKQHKLMREIDSFLEVEEKHRCNLRRFLARIEAHKQDYLYLGVKIEFYNELHTIILAAVKISQKLAGCLAGNLSTSKHNAASAGINTVRLVSNAPSVVGDASAEVFDDSIVKLAAIKDNLNTLLTETYNNLELQEIFFAASKINYFVEYVPANFKQRDNEFAIAAVGGKNMEDKVAVNVEKLGKTVKSRLIATGDFLHKLANMGLGIEPELFDKIIFNCDALLNYRFLYNEIEQIIQALKQSKTTEKSGWQKSHVRFKAKRDELKKLLLEHIKTNSQDLLANKGHRRAIIKKIIELLVQNAAYYRFIGEEPATSKFQKILCKDIYQTADSEVINLILKDLITLLHIKHLDQLSKNAGLDKINELAKKRYAMDS